MSHPWKSSGAKRTIVWDHPAAGEMLLFLQDMRDAIQQAILVAGIDAARTGRVPSPIQLRREVKGWFATRYDYARHHINPVCRSAVAILRASKGTNANGSIPKAKRLAMRIDGELFKLDDGRIRVTLRPGGYYWIPVNTKNKKFKEYSKGRASELLVTERKVCLTFVISKEDWKPVGSKLVGVDLNFMTLDSSEALRLPSSCLRSVRTQSLREAVRIPGAFSRRRIRLSKRVKNPKKRSRKLKETRGRQRNRIKDFLHKLSTSMVRENPDTTFIFEDLRRIRQSSRSKSKGFRTYLNRWPFRMYQSFVDYKSRNKTLYVNPRGTSSECPVCGEKLEHPTWGTSRCNKCGVDYDRNRLASLAILCRGARLCGQPFAVSADASWQHLRDEYLYAGGVPGESARADGTNNVAYAPNQVSLAEQGPRETARPDWTNEIRRSGPEEI